MQFVDRFVAPDEFFTKIIQKNIIEKVQQLMEEVAKSLDRSYKVYYDGLEKKFNVRKLYVIVELNLSKI